MAGTPCKKCDGHGTVEKDGKLYECECEMLRRIAMSMDAAIRKAPARDEHLNHPLIELVTKDCFVVASWADMKAILKVATIKHYPRFIKVISDLDIKTVFVGARSKQSHADDYQGPVFNSIEDLMDPPSLAVVVLNRLTHDNKAASGALEEALCYRLDKAKPTWVLSDLDRPFSVGSPAYSSSVSDLLQTAYQPVNVPRITPQMSLTAAMNHVGGQMPESTLSPEPAPRQLYQPRQERGGPPQRRIQSAPQDEDITTMVGTGIQKKKKFQTRGD